NQLPSGVILFLVTVMLVILVSLPWIKLYQMGNRDRLTTTDGIASIAVSMLLMSLLFFTFFKYNTPLRPKTEKDSKVALGAQITSAFASEVAARHQNLLFIDRSVASNTALFANATGNTPTPAGFAGLDRERLEQVKGDPSIGQIFWVDSGGKETVKWTTDETNGPPGNFADRAYVMSIINGRPYRSAGGGPYYLDQVSSWVTGNFTSVISIPSRVSGQGAAVMSFTMKSLNTPLLPPGYQFAMVDKTGKVLYHSDRSRNLNENLVTEFSEHERLTGILESRTEGAFGTSYFGREFTVHVKPVTGLPYFLVVFSDLSYKATREMEIYSFTFSMLLILFGFFLLQLLVVFLVSSQRSFLKKQTYNTGWIGPKSNALRQYNLGSLFNLFVLGLAVAFFSISTFLTYIFILIFSVTVISLFLNYIFALSYKKDKLENYRFKITTCAWLLVLLFLIDVVALKVLDLSSAAVLFLYEAIILTAGVFFSQRGKHILSALRPKIHKQVMSRWNYKKSFALMALTRLIMTSGLPVCFFYISAYNYEQNISIRYRQLQWGQQLLQSVSEAELSKVDTNTAFGRGYYKDGVWIRKVSVAQAHPPLSRSEEDSITSKILDLFRINFTNLAVREDRFSSPQASDSAFRYNPLLKDAVKKDSVTRTSIRLNTPNRYLAIESAGLNYKIPSLVRGSWHKGLLFWVLLGTALVFFYFIVYNIITKLFCLNLPDLSFANGLDGKIIANQDVNNLLFVIGLPGTKKISLITDAVAAGDIIGRDGSKLKYVKEDPEAGNVCIADLIKIPDIGTEDERKREWQAYADETIFDKRNRLIIVNHFEYNIQDAVTNRIKLNFLEQLMGDERCKVIVLSTIHPVAFLDSATEPSGTTDAPLVAHDMERWHVLLGHYRILLYSLRHAPDEINFPHGYQSLQKETEHTHFLTYMQKPLLEVATELTRKHKPSKAEELIFKVQVTAHYFYMYIWQSLTKEEKFLLYDLAEDNLVNGYDDYNLNMLIAKGAIIRDNGTLKVFNRGFRNFILTAIGNTEAMKIKSRIQDNGNWQKVRTPLSIILLAILAFLLSSQREAYSELMAYIAALGAGIPMVLKLFTVFNKGGDKQ
ncbi:MAG TPA: cache domain-containing protein, partial [Flavisolibacter sp.]